MPAGPTNTEIAEFLHWSSIDYKRVFFANKTQISLVCIFALNCEINQVLHGVKHNACQRDNI